MPASNPVSTWRSSEHIQQLIRADQCDETVVMIQLKSIVEVRMATAISLGAMALSDDSI
jgi:CII-binding regulator of phage lambda lysogenization HflD